MDTYQIIMILVMGIPAFSAAIVYLMRKNDKANKDMLQTKQNTGDISALDIRISENERRIAAALDKIEKREEEVQRLNDEMTRDFDGMALPSQHDLESDMGDERISTNSKIMEAIPMMSEIVPVNEDVRDDFYITNAGREMLAALGAGETLTIDEIWVGSGNVSATAIDPRNLNDLLSPEATATRSEPVAVGDEVHFTIQYNNAMDKTGTAFVLGEYGGFMLHPENGRTMIFYGSLGNFPFAVPSYAEAGLAVFSMPVAITLSDGKKLEFGFPSGVLATPDDVDARVSMHERKLVSDPGGVHGLEMQVNGDEVTALINGIAYALGGGRINPADLVEILAAINTRAPANTALSTAQWSNALASALGNVTQARMQAIDTIVARLTDVRATALDRIGAGNAAASSAVVATTAIQPRLRFVMENLFNDTGSAARVRVRVMHWRLTWIDYATAFSRNGEVRSIGLSVNPGRAYIIQPGPAISGTPEMEFINVSFADWAPVNPQTQVRISTRGWFFTGIPGNFAELPNLIIVEYL